MDLFSYVLFHLCWWSVNIGTLTNYITHHEMSELWSNFKVFFSKRKISGHFHWINVGLGPIKFYNIKSAFFTSSSLSPTILINGCLLCGFESESDKRDGLWKEAGWCEKWVWKRKRQERRIMDGGGLMWKVGMIMDRIWIIYIFNSLFTNKHKIEWLSIYNQTTMARFETNIIQGPSS